MDAKELSMELVSRPPCCIAVFQVSALLVKVNHRIHDCIPSVSIVASHDRALLVPVDQHETWLGIAIRWQSSTFQLSI